jgi:hypothetical protein
LIDDTGGSQLHCVVNPQRMALDEFNGKINDPWLSRDDAILRGVVGLEGRVMMLRGRVWQVHWSLLPA